MIKDIFIVLVVGFSQNGWMWSYVRTFERHGCAHKRPTRIFLKIELKFTAIYRPYLTVTSNGKVHR